MVYLVFPSSWHPSQPYLSLPSLKGYLHMHGIQDVEQRDLAIELLDHLCTWEKTKPLYERITRELSELGAKPRHSQFEQEKFAKLREAEETIPALMYEIDAAKASMRCEDFYNLDRYMESLKIIDVWLDNILASYYPSQLTVIGSQMRYSPYSTKEIFESFNNPNENFFYDIYKEHYLPSILKRRHRYSWCFYHFGGTDHSGTYSGTPGQTGGAPYSHHCWRQRVHQISRSYGTRRFTCVSVLR